MKELLIYSTVRIECQLKDGTTSLGTAFFYQFLEDEKYNISLLGLVTNKHVIEGAISGKIVFCQAQTDNEPIDNSHLEFNVPDFFNKWIPHPDNSVDLCAMPIDLISDEILQRGLNASLTYIFKKRVPDLEKISSLSPFQDVLMIGYPIGLWDETNNKPIVRKGITATSIKFDYCGKKEFLIDAACFPGSSGSPVFAYSENQIFKDGEIINEFDFCLIGILSSGPEYYISGEIQMKNSVTGLDLESVTSIPINLGYCIKSERLHELATVLHEKKPESYRKNPDRS